jgi:hypothetical protein
MNQGYRGHAERCTWEFSIPLPEWGGVAAWTAEQMVNAHISALAEQNAILLELQVYEDISPDFTTNYRVVTTSSASPLFWNLIILGVLAAIIFIAISYTITKVEDIAQYLGPTAFSSISLGLIAAIILGGVLILRNQTSKD